MAVLMSIATFAVCGFSGFVIGYWHGHARGVNNRAVEIIEECTNKMRYANQLKLPLDTGYKGTKLK
jgi:hypothetical protein